jgi:hypothetical protein
MDLWYPPEHQAPLLEWWTPLLLAASAARRERVPWPIHFDDFELQGRVDRDGRPAIWVYLHTRSGQELYLDQTGQAYKFTRTPNGRSYGRFTASDIRSAVHRAGLPRYVAPVWYDDPDTAPRVDTPSLPFGDEPPAAYETWPLPGQRHVATHEPDVRTVVDAAPTRPRRRPRPGARRGHLTLIQGGRQAG